MDEVLCRARSGRDRPFVGEQIACAKGILAGTVTSEEYEAFMGDVRSSCHQRAAVAFAPNNLRDAK